MSKIGIVGAGIIGVCIAHFLKLNGHEVILFDKNDPGSQTSFGNAGLFASHECVTANSPHLWKNIPRMLFDKNSPVVVDWFYILKNLPWGIKFLKNCTSKKVDHIAKSLSNFSRHAILAYDEIFNEIDLMSNIIKKEP
ncbi:uncharacterized protein METZ01_LOCUS411019, partial [marine metagenome]